MLAPVSSPSAYPHLRALPCSFAEPQKEQFLLGGKFGTELEISVFQLVNTPHRLFQREVLNKIPQAVAGSKKFCKKYFGANPYYDIFTSLLLV